MNTLSKIGFGCVGLSAQSSLKNALKLLNIAYESGIRLYDTAPVYGQGYSEVVLGKFLKNKRDQVSITTKFGLGNVKKPNLPATIALPLNHLKKQLSKPQLFNVAQNYTKTPKREVSLNQVKFDFEGSLKRLQTDYIDNYLLHEGTPDFLTEEAINFLFELKDKGLVKKIGVGICHKNLEDISTEELNNWDILQYENNYQLDTSSIYSKFPHKEHIHHSLLKNVKNYKSAGELMAQHLVDFPNAKMLFSTSKGQNIIQNIKETIHLYEKKIS